MGGEQRIKRGTAGGVSGNVGGSGYRRMSLVYGRGTEGEVLRVVGGIRGRAGCRKRG